MRLLQFVQHTNTVLSTVETGCSLVGRAQGGAVSSNNPAEALSQQIENVGSAVTSEIRDARDVLQQDVRTVGRMVSHVIAQQNSLAQEIHQVIQGVSATNVLMKNHMRHVQDLSDFVVEEKIEEARYGLTKHLAGQGLNVEKDMIGKWLFDLQKWIDKDSMRKITAISSEDAVRLLSKSSDNMGLIALRLHALFGELIPEKFLSLPKTSLKYYILIVKLYLKTLEKNPNLLGTDKAASICEKIIDTLKCYDELFSLLKDNPQITQALFDQYANAINRDECRGLLEVIVPLLNEEKFNTKLKSLATNMSVTKSSDIWDQLLKTLPENKRIEILLNFLKQKNVNVTTTQYMILPESMPYLPIPSEIKWAPYATSDGSGQATVSQWGTGLFGRPKPAAFCTNSMLLLCLASGYGSVADFENSTLKSHVWKLIHQAYSSSTYSQTTYHKTVYQVFYNGQWQTIDNKSLDGMGRGIGSSGFYVDLNGRRFCADFMPPSSANSWLLALRSHIPESSTTYYYQSNPSLYGGHRANIFQYHANLGNNLPIEYKAILDSVSNGILKNVKPAFDYCALILNGKLNEAALFETKNKIDAICLLFLTSIINRPDIFINFVNKNPLPEDFNYSRTVGSWTPLMFAAKLGSHDFIASILPKIKITDLVKRSTENKTALDYAREQGFEKIAINIENAQRGILPVMTVAISDESDDKKGLEAMLESVSASKTKLGQYDSASIIEVQQAMPAAAFAPLPEEMTDDDLENKLEEKTSEFFKKENMHAGKTTFWRKARVNNTGLQLTENNRGLRVIDSEVFASPEQQNSFFLELFEKKFSISRITPTNQLLVKLPTEIKLTQIKL